MLLYAIKSSLCLVALYLPYMLLLRGETFVRMNRFVLLGILLLSMVLPLLNLPCLAVDYGQMQVWRVSVEVGAPMLDDGVDDAVATGASTMPSGINWFLFFTLLYIIGVCVTLVVRTIQVLALHRAIRRGCLWTSTEPDGTVVYCHAGEQAPFSWFGSIVVSQADMDECGDVILCHERAHALHHHSADMVLVMVCEALQWFNPFVWLLSESLRDLHEYEADRCVLASGIDMKQYQLLLIKKTVGKAWPAFTNSLKSNLLKKRFKMMQQKQSSPWQRVRVLYMLPIALVALSVFAKRTDVTAPNPAVIATPAEAIVASADTVATDDRVFSICEELPEFHDLQGYLIHNLKYPQEAVKYGAKGRVLVTFIVETNGKLSHIEVAKNTVGDSLNGKCSEQQRAAIVKLFEDECKRVVGGMPAWTPGKQRGNYVRVKFSIPVVFQSQNVTAN